MIAASELYDKETRFFGREEYDLDWDTFNDGRGMTMSQLAKKKLAYKKKGYKCRSVPLKGMPGRYILYTC